jgi:hypothetical protein
MLAQLQVSIVAVCIISLCIATFAISCRWYARALTKKRWQADDYLMVVAYVGLLAFYLYRLSLIHTARDLWSIDQRDHLRLQTVLWRASARCVVL